MPSSSAALLHDVKSAVGHASLGPEDLLIVGLSGGVDSQTLTHALAALRDSGDGPKLQAIHVDHRLRASSATDAEACEHVAERMGVPIEVIEVDVDEWNSGRGIEAAARDARFAALARAAEFRGTKWISLGHSLDDQVETVLMRLARGTSLDGLTAMRGISERAVQVSPSGNTSVSVKLFRPLLGRTRAEIEEYAAEHKLTPIDDPTNADPRFRRNAIRHQLVPLLEQISPGARHSIARSIKLFDDDAVYLEQLASAAYARAVRRLGSCLALSRTHLAPLPRPIQSRVVALAVHELSWHVDLTNERIEAVCRAIVSGAPSHNIEVGDRIDARVDYDRIVMGPASMIEPVLRAESGLPLMKPAVERDIHGEMRILLDSDWSIDVSVCSSRTGWVLRTRRPGDRVKFGSGEPQKLQDWFVNRKVPSYLRDHVPLLVNDGLVRWIAGFSSPSFEDVDSGLTARLEESTEEDRRNDERVAGHPSA